MRNPFHAPGANKVRDARRRLAPATEPALSLRMASNDVISNFLANAVMDRFNRESANHEVVSRSPAPEKSFTSSDNARVDLRVLPPPEIHTGAPAKIPLWKRVLDISIILLTCPLWLPVMFVIMLMVKATSAGPIFYRQERVGYRGRRFMIFKFRTMKVNVDTCVHESHFERLIATDSPMTKLDEHGDPRLIKCGRFFRAAGLDELPQIFNVLRGEMSLVGARPCTLHEFQRYQSWQRERVNGPPGLTGYWQVNGKNKTTFSEMIEMDIFYGKHMSLGLDLSIMIRTPFAIAQQVLETRGMSLWWRRRATRPPGAHRS